MSSIDIALSNDTYTNIYFNSIDEVKSDFVEKTFSAYLEFAETQIEDNKSTDEESNN